MEDKRSITLFGATLIGVGAIVGGGFLALAGAAFEATGPGALVAFLLNAIIALITALSFAEMSTLFPISGGAYVFSRKVLSIQAAFVVGWVVWFASIVAAVLYAAGFAAYAVTAITLLVEAWGYPPPTWLSGRIGLLILALAATGFYTYSLTRKSGGGGQGETIGKMVVFAILIVGGLWSLPQLSPATVWQRMTPMFPHGAAGLFQAMGFTFIALQGFDLIAAVAGEVKDPNRNLPRAMLYSLAAALLVYIPLLFLVATVGISEGTSVMALAAEHPDTLVALAARNFMGGAGFWLVVGAALLAMLSALQANLFAASRVAYAMACDRTLSHRLSRLDGATGIPTAAVLVSSAIVALLLLLLSDVADAGAAASLIFLLSFALTHWIALLSRQRLEGRGGGYQTPFFPLVPGLGVLSCTVLALFQGFAVPAAGAIALVWIAAGGFLYVSRFERRARVVDAAAEAIDPELVRLRGRSPLVLIPVANPQSAEAMVAVGSALSTPSVGRVLLLSVVTKREALEDAQKVLHNALTASFEAERYPEALTTLAPDPWKEISRVSSLYRCESLLVGLTHLQNTEVSSRLDEIFAAVEADVVVLRAPPDWHLDQVKKVLVPVSAAGIHDVLRARLLSSLSRQRQREVTYLRIIAPGDDPEVSRRMLRRMAADENPGESEIEVLESDHAVETLVARAADADLVVMGLHQVGTRGLLSGFVLEVASDTRCGLLLLGHHR